MLTEERHSIIIDTVNRKKNVELNELCELLDTSESTVRRDLSILHDKGVLVKVRGGAIAVDDSFTSLEQNVDEKAVLYVREKERSQGTRPHSSRTGISYSSTRGRPRRR